MARCDACQAEVIPASKQWIDRVTWEITDKDQLFYLDPEPNPDGRFSIIGVGQEGQPVQALYVPFREEGNLKNPNLYMTHASTCTYIPENNIDQAEYEKVTTDG
jgi:hypothetical protein